MTGRPKCTADLMSPVVLVDELLVLDVADAHQDVRLIVDEDQRGVRW